MPRFRCRVCGAQGPELAKAGERIAWYRKHWKERHEGYGEFYLVHTPKRELERLLRR